MLKFILVFEYKEEQGGGAGERRCDDKDVGAKIAQMRYLKLWPESGARLGLLGCSSF